MIKSIWLALCVITLAQTNAFANVRVISTEHRDADYFKRLSEYVTGDEDPGRYVIFRTMPSERDGFYISLKASNKKELKSVTAVRLHYVRPGTQEVTTAEMPAKEFKKKRIIVGLTGAEWSSGDTFPVAWKIEFVDMNESVVDSVESFLWAEPIE